MLRNLLWKDTVERYSNFHHSHCPCIPEANAEAENVLVAPKALSKLFCVKERNPHQKAHRRKEYLQKTKMQFFRRNDHVEASEGSDISQEDSTSNQEILVPHLTTRNKCFQKKDFQKLSQFNCNSPNIEMEERSFGVRQTNIVNHPNIVEHKIKVVKDKRLKMSLPRIESSTKNVETFYYGSNKGSGDVLKGELSDFLTYPVNVDNIKIPRKKELHRLMHHRICNYVNPDIVLVIDEHEFFCHRMVLQCYSKYFDEINNLSDNKIITIDENGVTKQAFTAIYAWMLSLNETGLKYITRENFVEVFLASQVLQIKDLEEQCLALIESTEVFSEGHAYQLFKQASRHNQQNIKEMMVPRIQHFFLPFVSTQDFLELSLEDVCIFLSSSYIVVHSEMEVFMSAARWLLEDWNTRKLYLPRVMNCVRFGLMNPLELVDIRKNPCPEFLKITEDSIIQKYIDDGLAYSTYSAMKGSSDDLEYRCQLFGLEIPQPRNWSDTPKYYKSYNEFLNYLKKIRTNPLKIIDEDSQPCPSTPSSQSFPMTPEENTYELDFTSPLHTLTDGIPSMSNLLTVGLKNKAKREKHENFAKSKYKLESCRNPNPITSDDNNSNTLTNKSNQSITTTTRKSDLLRSLAATIIQAAYRGYRVRKKMKTALQAKYTNIPTNHKIANNTINPKPTKEIQRRSLKKSSSDNNLSTISKISHVPGSLYLPFARVILIFGGLNPQQELNQNNDGKSILRYSSESNKWNRVNYLPRGRYYHNTTYLKGKVYVVGGVDPKREELRLPCICPDVWSFNPVNCEWTKETNLKTPRKNFGLVSFQGFIYAIGGQGPNDAILSSVEKYDPVKKTWEEVCPLPEPKLCPAVCKYGGTIWVAGGMGSTAKHAMSEQVYSYDYRQNRWLNKPSLRNGKGFASLLLHDDRLYLVGGAEKDKDRGLSLSSGNIDVFDPRQSKWEFYAQMRVPRHSHVSAILENCLYIMGGTTTQQMKSLCDVETWCFETRSWKHPAPHLPLVLTGHAAILLPPGSPEIE